MSQPFASGVAIEGMLLLVQVMTWHQKGAKPLPEPMTTKFPDTYMQTGLQSDISCSQSIMNSSHAALNIGQKDMCIYQMSNW